MNTCAVLHFQEKIMLEILIPILNNVSLHVSNNARPIMYNAWNSNYHWRSTSSEKHTRLQSLNMLWFLMCDDLLNLPFDNVHNYSERWSGTVYTWYYHVSSILVLRSLKLCWNKWLQRMQSILLGFPWRSVSAGHFQRTAAEIKFSVTKWCKSFRSLTSPCYYCPLCMPFIWSDDIEIVSKCIGQVICEIQCIAQTFICFCKHDTLQVSPYSLSLFFVFWNSLFQEWITAHSRGAVYLHQRGTTIREGDLLHIYC